MTAQEALIAADAVEKLPKYQSYKFARYEGRPETAIAESRGTVWYEPAVEVIEAVVRPGEDYNRLLDQEPEEVARRLREWAHKQGD